jgi:CBS domain-containing protein
VRLFVDAARIIALAAGVHHTNTAERLRQAGPRLRMTPEEIASAVDAFFFIQGLRLRMQLGFDVSIVADPNRMNPSRLNEIDRRILKESLRQARRLQTRLALDYQL